MNKSRWLDAAHVFDTWRVIPRMTLITYAWWVGHVTSNVLAWYEHLPAIERTLEASGLAGAIITAVTGLAVWVFKIYTDTAVDWSGTQSSSTSTSITTETK